MCVRRTKRHLTLSVFAVHPQISTIDGSAGNSLVQLNRPDCIAKLGLDLLNLFVVQPTPQLDLSLVQINSLYLRCYQHRLVPAVYGMRTLEGVIEGEKYISLLLKVCAN